MLGSAPDDNSTSCTRRPRMLPYNAPLSVRDTLRGGVALTRWPSPLAPPVSAHRGDVTDGGALGLAHCRSIVSSYLVR